MHPFFSSDLCFGPFRFNARQRALFKRGRRIPLRAKAADLLHVIVSSANEVVPKAVLRERVWGSANVSDQSLFQTICEVRRALAPHEAVVTHPNKGYRFALPVRSGPRAGRLLVAAAVLVCAGVVVLTGRAGLRNAPPQRALMSLSPSMQAFATGVAKLEAGDLAQAQILLLLSLREDANFVDARLMLGEAYLAQGDPEKALDQGRRVLIINERRADPDARAAVAAMALISRAEDTAGSVSRALHWAIEAAERAYVGGLVCTASDIQSRIDRMMAERSVAPAPQPLRAPASAASRLAKSDATPVLPDYCSGLPMMVAPPEAHTLPGPCRSPQRRVLAATLRTTGKSMV